MNFSHRGESLSFSRYWLFSFFVFCPPSQPPLFFLKFYKINRAPLPCSHGIWWKSGLCYHCLSGNPLSSFFPPFPIFCLTPPRSIQPGLQPPFHWGACPVCPSPQPRPCLFLDEFFFLVLFDQASFDPDVARFFHTLASWICFSIPAFPFH